MNKLKYFLLLIPLFIFSCKGKTVEEIVDKHPDGSPKLVRYYNVSEQIRSMVKEVRYYPNHQKYYEGEFKDNKKDGRWTVWYDNGRVWSEGTFKKGVDEGRRTAYYENGQKHFQGQYDNGNMTGTWKFWDEKGKQVQEIDYDKK
jgi:antitoxin component YwqK of YwqJK toxin-antitoxin module